MPEQPGFNPDHEQARRQEFGEDDERLQPPSAATVGRLIKLADRLLNYPEAYTSLMVDFRLHDGVFASVGYGRSGDHAEENWSLVIDRYIDGSGEGEDIGDADDFPRRIAEFGTPDPVPDSSTYIDMELEDSDEDEAEVDDDETEDSGLEGEDELTSITGGMIYDHAALRQAAGWARRSGQPQFLQEALEELIQAGADDATAPEIATHYDLATGKMLELGRQIPAEQADEVSQHVDIRQPDDSLIRIRQYLQHGMPAGQQRRLLIQCIGDETLTLKVLGDEPPRFTNVRQLAPDDWMHMPTKEWRGDAEEIDEKLGSESDHDLDLASEENVQEVIRRLQQAREA